MNDPRWVPVCELVDLVPQRGVAALVEGRQIALFRLLPENEVLAIANRDPFSEASVLARGIVGSVGDTVVVASPMYKQHFDLRAGRSVEDPSVAVDTFRTRVRGGVVEIGLTS
jgi:NAD(P)H-dependent nitrite reductase small subunit